MDGRSGEELRRSIESASAQNNPEKKEMNKKAFAESLNSFLLTLQVHHIHIIKVFNIEIYNLNSYCFKIFSE